MERPVGSKKAKAESKKRKMSESVGVMTDEDREIVKEHLELEREKLEEARVRREEEMRLRQEEMRRANENRLALEMTTGVELIERLQKTLGPDDPLTLAQVQIFRAKMKRLQAVVEGGEGAGDNV